MSKYSPTFAIDNGFMGLCRHEPDDSKYVIAGIPLDIGTTNRSGARDGPRAIRQASRMLVDGMHPHWWFDPNKNDIADIGNFNISLGDIRKSLKEIERQARGINHLIAMGGDHGMTLGLLRALNKKYGPIALVDFDAHVDTWPENFGQKYAHGSVFYNAICEGLISPYHSVQIGIRSPVDKSVWNWTEMTGIKIITALEVHEKGIDFVVNKILTTIRSKLCYLSFDIDALDPAYAPGTGTPEIGGLATWQAQSIMRRLNEINFIGMDIVEVAPAYDHSEITALAAATIIWEYLSLCFFRNQ